MLFWRENLIPINVRLSLSKLVHVIIINYGILPYFVQSHRPFEKFRKWFQLFCFENIIIIIFQYS